MKYKKVTGMSLKLKSLTHVPDTRHRHRYKHTYTQTYSHIFICLNPNCSLIQHSPQ